MAVVSAFPMRSATSSPRTYDSPTYTPTKKAPAAIAPSTNSQNRTLKIPDTKAGSVTDAMKVRRPKARSPLASRFRRRLSSHPGLSSSGRPP